MMGNLLEPFASLDRYRSTHVDQSPKFTFRLSLTGRLRHVDKGKGSPYSINERRVPELITVLGSQPAGDVSHKPGGMGCHYFPLGLQLPPQPLRGLLPISLLDEQRHDGCEQFA